MFAPRLTPNSTSRASASYPYSQLATLSYHFLTAEAPLTGDFGSTTHDHALLHSSEAEPLCLHIFPHSFAKNTGGWGLLEAKVSGKESFRGKKLAANPFGITFLYDPSEQLPWNHILAKNMGAGGAHPLGPL
jgi:hypothetical protein